MRLSQLPSEAKIIALDPQHRAAARTAFQKFSLAALLKATASGGVSSYDELLKQSGLTAAHQAAFAELYFSQGSEAEGLWQKAEALGIPKDKIAVLQLQARLLYLTLNNAPLTEALQREIKSLDNLPRLVDGDLHEPEEWKTRLHRLSGNNEKSLAALIPSIYGADTIADRLELSLFGVRSRRVRMSFSTHVTARLLESGGLNIPGMSASVANAVAKFLRKAVPLGYRLGESSDRQIPRT